MISVATLIAAGVEPSLARTFEAPLRATCLVNDINTRLRVAMFVAQCAYESRGFVRLEESMWYRDTHRIRAMWPTRVPTFSEAQAFVGHPHELANHVYANRFGNGDEASGDGWKFIGRGLIHLTFRDNYRRCGQALQRPYEEQPELLASPEDACASAGWYWRENHINMRADSANVEAVTRIINPKLVGLDARRGGFAAAMEAFA